MRKFTFKHQWPWKSLQALFALLLDKHEPQIIAVEIVFLQETLDGKVQLSGYGVELAVKSTEYKAVDDQKVERKDEGRVTSNQQDHEDEVEGFIFGTLR